MHVTHPSLRHKAFSVVSRKSAHGKASFSFLIFVSSAPRMLVIERGFILAVILSLLS